MFSKEELSTIFQMTKVMWETGQVRSPEVAQVIANIATKILRELNVKPEQGVTPGQDAPPRG